MIDIYDSKNTKIAQQILRDGQRGDFWQIISEAVDEIIKDIQEQIDGKEITNYPAKEYKVMMEILKGRKRDLLKLKELPENLIMEIENPDQSEPDVRVYDDISDLKLD